MSKIKVDPAKIETYVTQMKDKRELVVKAGEALKNFDMSVLQGLSAEQNVKMRDHLLVISETLKELMDAIVVYINQAVTAYQQADRQAGAAILHSAHHGGSNTIMPE